ncbi:MAG TPA: ABC transporter ATP-binding protein [Candidatus Koribacter sp.]|jgi:ABC-2 type transport system ATP-binding protein
MIACRQLRREYGDLTAVQDLNLTVPPGEILGLIGPNGAGKTTTIRMMCGLLTPTSGEVSVCGVKVQEAPELAQTYIGYLSDFFNVYDDLKVWEYVDYFASAYKMPEAGRKERIDEVIAQVGLEVKHDAFIHGLSRGMKQRLGIARAIVHRPKVLILDEPASGLDPKSRADLRNLLLSLRDAGATVLISSHVLSELEGFCTSIAIMEKGVLVRSGRVDEIASEQRQHKVVRVAWSGATSVAPVLQVLPSVSELAVNSTEAVFRFAGNDDQLPDVLAALVGAGVRVSAFGEVKQTIEDIYLKISRNEVM